MAGPLTSPWAPPEGRLQDAFRIADMIRDTGRIQAQGQYNKRMAVSDLVGGVAGTAFDLIDANQQKKAMQEIGAILASGKPFDANALVAKYGVKATKEAYSLYSAMQPKPDTFSSVDPEKDLINDRTGEIMRKGRAKEPTAAEQRAAEKYDKDARAETVDEQMRTWADEALRSGAVPSEVQSQYYRETGKSYPLSMNPETPNEVALAIRAAQGDRQAAAALKIMREQKDGGRNPTEASLASDAAHGDVYAAKALEMLRKGSSAGNPTNASLALAAAKGDKDAQKALELLNPEKPAKPPTGPQGRAFTFYGRAEQADKDLQAIEAQLESQTTAGQAWMNFAWNPLLSDLQQQYRVASRVFNEARLRKDSGAQIRPDEEAGGLRDYFINAGDGKDTLAQKRRQRAKALETLAVEAGPAFSNYYGSEEEANRILEDLRKRFTRPEGEAAPPAAQAPAEAPVTGLFGGRAPTPAPTPTVRSLLGPLFGPPPGPATVPGAPPAAPRVAPQAAPPAQAIPPGGRPLGTNPAIYDTPAPAQLPTPGAGQSVAAAAGVPANSIVTLYDPNTGEPLAVPIGEVPEALKAGALPQPPSRRRRTTESRRRDTTSRRR